MRKLIKIALLSISFVSCSQEKNEKNIESITSENFVKKVLENVKHYDYEPVYRVSIYKRTLYK